MEMEADWDLYAIVRGSSCHHTSSETEESAAYSHLMSEQSLDDSLFSYDLGFSSDCFYSRSHDGLLDELFQFQHRKDDDDDDTHPPKQQPQKDELYDLYSSVPPLLLQPKPPSCISSSNLKPQNTTTVATAATFKRRRKNQLKKVRQVPADGLISSEDTWSWRKYGQKPIKGSPYPRGYYKCSTLKGCPARKQVERNRTDPDMFIVTYTAEHNHSAPTQRNSLAGTTRTNQNHRKFSSTVTLPVITSNANSVSSAGTEQRKEEVGHLCSLDEEGEMMMMIGEGVDGGGACRWLMEMEDDFFDGLDGEIKNVGNGDS